MVYQNFIKRLLDILLSLIAMPFVLIIVIICGLLIKIEDGGPIFYCGYRLGKHQKKFKMIKLRSMKVNAIDIRNVDGTTFNGEADDRVTKIGKIIRKLSLDEFPQFINVLLGDMSIVGPRPSPPGDKSMYPKEFLLKYNVRPGITGLTQATLRNKATMEDRIKLDKYYVENYSFMLDLKILALTFYSVIKRSNIYNEQ